MLIKKRNVVAVYLHLLSIELEFVQNLNILIFGFTAQIERECCVIHESGEYNWP